MSPPLRGRLDFELSGLVPVRAKRSHEESRGLRVAVEEAPHGRQSVAQKHKLRVGMVVVLLWQMDRPPGRQFSTRGRKGCE